MKKIAVTILAALMATSALSGCFGGDGNSSSSSSMPSSSSEPSSTSSSGIASTVEALIDGTTLEHVVAEVHKAFGENGAIAMPGKLDDQVLKDQFGINPEDVEEYYGEYSMVNTNSDVLVAIKAKPGKVDEVKTALEKRKADLETQFEQYPVNGSYDRAKAAKVYVRGDYVFLIGVGVLPEDADANPEFDKQVQKAQDTIDKFFK